MLDFTLQTQHKDHFNVKSGNIFLTLYKVKLYYCYGMHDIREQLTKLLLLVKVVHCKLNETFATETDLQITLLLEIGFEKTAAMMFTPRQDLFYFYGSSHGGGHRNA